MYNGDDDVSRVLLLEVSDEEYSSIREEPEQVRQDEATTYEEALKGTRYGKFHFFILFLCGWAVSSDAIEVLSLSFMLPTATCDLHLTSNMKGWLNSIIFVGMMFGGYIWGSLSDFQGRRCILLMSLTLNGLGALASSAAQQYWLFMILRFISGVGVGGSIPVIFSYFCEFQPKDKRGMMISVLATFWMFGNIIAAGLAWIIIPMNIGYYSSEFTFNSWRIFLALCTLPSLSSAAMFVLVPESPKFLLQAGRHAEALEVMRKIYKSNGTNVFPIKRLVLSHDDPNKEIKHNYGRKNIFSLIYKALVSSADLFNTKLKTVSFIMIIINFTLSFGFYGLWMWFPTLFSRLDSSQGSICEAAPSNQSSNQTDFCEPVKEWVYFEGFMTALSNLPGNIITIILMDRIGRKPLMVSGMLLSGVSVFFIWFVSTKVQNLIFACLFGAISTIGWNALDVLMTESYPTRLRSTAMGFMTAIVRVGAITGNVLFGLLVDVHCAVPMLMVAILLAIGGLSAIKLPNTTKADIH